MNGTGDLRSKDMGRLRYLQPVTSFFAVQTNLQEYPDPEKPRKVQG